MFLLVRDSVADHLLGCSLSRKPGRLLVQGLLEPPDLLQRAIADLCPLIVVLNGDVQAGLELTISAGVTAGLLDLPQHTPLVSRV